jgi:hypothetical protein
MIRVLTAVNTASNAAVNSVSLSWIRNLKLSARPLEGHQHVAGLLGHPLPVGWAVIPARCTRRVPCSTKNSTYRRRRNTVSTWKKSAARIVVAWASRNARPGLPGPPGCGIAPGVLQDLPHRRRREHVSQPGQLSVDAPVPQAGLSRAISRISARTDGAVLGLPGLRRGHAQCRRTRSACQRRRVRGETAGYR